MPPRSFSTHGWSRARAAAAASSGPATTWSYAETQERVNRIANVLVRDLGLQPGNRLLLRAPNSPSWWRSTSPR
jgi:2-aminobenzoate-CoA ligase